MAVFSSCTLVWLIETLYLSTFLQVCCFKDTCLKPLVNCLYFTDNISIFSCRFVLGGEHGRLKYGPPQGHSPVIESLLPKEKLKIEPCFFFGDVHKNVISGPTEILDYAPFVPVPVETGNVSTNHANELKHSSNDGNVSTDPTMEM